MLVAVTVVNAELVDDGVGSGAAVKSFVTETEVEVTDDSDEVLDADVVATADVDAVNNSDAV